MKIKVAAFIVVPKRSYSSVMIFDHEPSTPGFARVTEWAEVDLVELPEEELKVQNDAAKAAEREALQKKIAALDAVTP